MSDKKMVFGLTGLFAAVIIIMLLLIPVEKKHEYYQKWGELAVKAETDERARFAIDNEELYTDYWLNMLYTENEAVFDFAYKYPFNKDNYKHMTFTDEELNSNEVPAVYMNDPRWSYEMNGSVKSQGCVAVSITMANLYLNHNSDVDPVKALVYADEMGYYGLGGIGQENVSDIITHFGMTADEHVFDKDNGEKVTESELKSAVDTEGTVVIAAVQGTTFGDHALVIRGYDENGFFINDPADPEKTAKQWDFEVFENELVRYWVVTN